MSEQVQEQPNPTLQLELTLAQANAILAILGKQPFEQVEGLVALMRQQCIPQLQALAKADEEAAKAANNQQSNLLNKLKDATNHSVFFVYPKAIDLTSYYAIITVMSKDR